MKRKLTILSLGLLACLATIGGIAAWRVDDIAKKYKGFIQEKLASALGTPVHLGEISASVFPQPALVVTDLRAGSLATGKPDITVVELSACAALLPLLAGRLSISAIKLSSPHVTIVREPAGIQVRGFQRSSSSSTLPLPASNPTQEPSGAPSSSPIDVHVDRVTVTNGLLTVEDTTSGTISQFKAIELGSTLKLADSRLEIPTLKLSLTAPGDTPVEASADTCGFDTSSHAGSCSSLNLSTPAGSVLVRGNYQAKAGSGSLQIASDGLHLSHLKQSLLQYAPGLQALTVAGSASVALELELRGNNSAVKNGKLSLKGFSLSAPNSPRISDGDGEFSVRGPLADANIETSSLHVSLNGEPLTISTRLRAQPSQVVVESLSLHGFRGSAELPAVITTSPKPLTIKGAQSASNLSLQALLKAIRPGASPAITGTLASLRSDLSSLIVERPDQVDAHIDVVIRDGSIVGLNLLNQLMAKLSELPFISESLQRRIPKQFEGLFSRPDTPIRELTFSGKIERGQANLSRISLLSDIFDLKGSGTYSLRGDVSMACELTFSTELSTALLEKAPELKALTDNSDRLVIPLTLKGSAPAVLVLPDLASIAKKTSAGALQKLLQDGLKGGKGLGKDLKKIFGF